MKRNIFFVGAFMVFGFLVSCNAKEKPQSPPNIIWLMAEDISIDLECYGMQAVKTPNLNRLANEGLRFENAFVTNPICSPSRSAMLVGVHQNKINAHHHRSNRNEPLAKGYYPFTYHLRNAGYTAILGHHGVMNKGRKIDVNFKTKAIGSWDGKTRFGLFDKYDTFSVADQPFFAQVQLQVTHRGDWWDEVRDKSKHPVNPDSVLLPPFMADHPTIRLDWAKYLDQIEYMDAEVGMILDELKEKGLADNTIVIFIGDNGRCNVRGKGYLHDPGLRIPLIIFDPRGPKGEVRREVVSATDITATILAYAGLDIPGYMTGQNIFDPDFNRSYSFGARDLWDEVMERSRSISSDKWRYIRNDMPEMPFDAHQAYLEFYRPAVHVMRSLNEQGKLKTDEKFFFQNTKPVEELYDLERDPYELHNLALDPEYAAVLDHMRNEIESYETEYSPINDFFEPVHPGAVDVLEWVKNIKPDEYQRMLDGIEIGFKKMSEGYKNSMRN